jgi:hypothetical protein
LGSLDAMNGNTRVPASPKGHTCGFGNGIPDGDCGGQGVEMFGSILLCERHLKEAEARERKDHREEVDIYLSMWAKIAQARGNETLLRLLRYAQIEARTDRMYERRAQERAISAGH